MGQIVPLDPLLRLPVVMRLTGLSRSRLYSLSKDGDFPPSRKIGARAVAWRQSGLARGIAGRPEATSSDG